MSAVAAADPFFGAAVVDTDEWRERPWRHRYVHGSFADTDTRFSVYLPEPAAYSGRWLQWLQGGAGGSEHVALAGTCLVAARQLGAYVVESNQGHIGNDVSGLKGDPSILQWRASAASARAARALAEEMYGAPPGHGYVVGGSGGAMRVTFCLEREPDLWDGGVAFMINHGGLAAHSWSLMVRAQLLLRDRLSAIVDAVDAGGSKDVFGVLENDEQRMALAHLYRAGFPRGAEHLLVENAIWALGLQGALAADPAYFEDFWIVPGYAGADDPALERLRVRREATVARVLSSADLVGAAGRGGDMAPGGVAPGVHLGLGADFPVAVATDLDPVSRGLTGARITVTSGAEAGRSLLCTGFVGTALTAMVDPAGFAGVEPGDRLELDNRDHLAYAHVHRHLLDPSHPSTTQLAVDGRPLYPVRHGDLDLLAQLGSGRVHGKLILLQHTLDRECWPECAAFFAGRVRSQLGAAADDVFRLWWVENAAHLVPTDAAGLTRLISYAGCYHRALHHLVAWVEEGVAPPPSTPYSFTPDRALQLPVTAAERGGVQQTVALTVNGADRAEVGVGEAVTLATTVGVPVGGMPVARVEWDVDGSGAWLYRRDASPMEAGDVSAEIQHSFDAPGRYMVTTRVSCLSADAAALEGFPIQNLARARVVVRRPTVDVGPQAPAP